MLKNLLLNIFNGIAFIAILFVVFFFWVDMNQQFMWAPILVILILLLMVYVNSRKMLVQYIEKRKKSSNKPVDVKAEKRLNIINVLAIISILFIAVVTWIYMNQQFRWAMVLIFLVLLLVGAINAWKLISDIR
jgi:hypothetical protein